MCKFFYYLRFKVRLKILSSWERLRPRTYISDQSFKAQDTSQGFQVHYFTVLLLLLLLTSSKPIGSKTIFKGLNVHYFAFPATSASTKFFQTQDTRKYLCGLHTLLVLLQLTLSKSRIQYQVSIHINLPILPLLLQSYLYQ